MVAFMRQCCWEQVEESLQVVDASIYSSKVLSRESMDMPNRKSALTLALAIWMIIFQLPTPAAASSEQLSPAGGIGNTRGDFEVAWSPLKKVPASNVMLGSEYAYFDTSDPNLQLWVRFILDDGAHLGPDDRLVWMAWSYVKPVSTSTVEAVIARYLPSDAEFVRTQTTHFGDQQDVYYSASYEKLLPELILDGKPVAMDGTIYVTVVAGSPEISLWNDYARE